MPVNITHHEVAALWVGFKYVDGVHVQASVGWTLMDYIIATACENLASPRIRQPEPTLSPSKVS